MFVYHNVLFSNNPIDSTFIGVHRRPRRTFITVSHGENSGSIPLGSTNTFRHLAIFERSCVWISKDAPDVRPVTIEPAPNLSNWSVRAVLDNGLTQSATFCALSAKLNNSINLSCCSPQTLHDWVKKAEIDSGQRAGLYKAKVIHRRGPWRSLETVEFATLEPVFDKSARSDGTFSRDDFTFDQETDIYRCPAGKVLASTATLVNDAATLHYRASNYDCDICKLKPRCCPKTPSRKVPRSIYERARDVARGVARTEAYVTSRRERKKIEMLFAHLKRILRLDRLRLRGPHDTHDEFLLAATAQNPRRLAKRVPSPAPMLA